MIHPPLFLQGRLRAGAGAGTLGLRLRQQHRQEHRGGLQGREFH